MILNPFTPVTPPPSDTPTATATITITPRPTDPDTDTPTPTPTQTFTPTLSATPSITPTKTPAPVNFVLPTVCVQPTEYDVFSIYVRSGPGTDRGVLKDAPVIEVGKCPVIGGHNEEETWLMIAYNQPDPEYQPYEGGWIRKDLFDLSMPVFIPEITLTPTPTITFTPTITPTFTVTLSPTPTRYIALQHGRLPRQQQTLPHRLTRLFQRSNRKRQIHLDFHRSLVQLPKTTIDTIGKCRLKQNRAGINDSLPGRIS